MMNVRKGLGGHASGVALKGLVIAAAMAVASPVFAQATSGSLYGTTSSGATVIVKSSETGLTRTIEVGADGKFNVTTLPTGKYSVTMEGPDGTKINREVTVRAGIGTAVDFATTELAAVKVIGATMTPIDVTTSQVSTTLDAEQLERLPVAKDIISVALLAPGTIKGDAAFGNLASFGGSSVAENSYYINGFNVTNLFKNLEYGELPFYAIASQQILTGGYGPEYGLSTGGVINLITKKGSNEWNIGGAVTWEPDFLRESSPSSYTRDFEPYRSYEDNEKDVYTYDVWAGGPIVRDTLFFYAIAEFQKTEQLTLPYSYWGGSTSDSSREKPYYLAKIDWNINDSNIIELTAVHNENNLDDDRYSTEYGSNGFTSGKGDYLGTDYMDEGGDIYIGKFTSYLTDSLTLSLSYGVLKNDRKEHQVLPDGTRVSYNGVVGDFDQPGCPYISTGLYGYDQDVPRCYLTSSIASATGEDERKAGRLDLEYRLPVDLIGYHTLKAGYQEEEWTTKYGESYAGGAYYAYRPGSDPTSVSDDRVRVRHFQTGTDIGVDTESYYLKDEWQIAPTLLLSLGIRNDSFSNDNGSGQDYVKQDDIWQPRLGFAWDVTGDSTKKLYGNYGRYSLPIAATVAVRGAAASIYDEEYFTFDGWDAVTGEPTNMVAIPNTFRYLNGEDGSPPNPESVADINLDPTIQDEYILGYQQEIVKNWTMGVRATYRDLKKTIDDQCDTRALERWAERNEVDYNYSGTPGCFMINPGYDATMSLDIDGNGDLETVDLSADDIGLPKAKRQYLAFDFSLEKAWTNGWYMQATYTWSHNWGNAEGLVKSDIGQDDTGVTQDFDMPELMKGAEGNLPNDRRHSFKLFGAFQMAPEWVVSASTYLITGRPKNCLGVDSSVPYELNYGGSYFTCGGQEISRGAAGRTDTIFNLDLGVTYQPKRIQGLELQAKVFNIFDMHAVTGIEETGEELDLVTDENGDYVIDPNSAYGYPMVYGVPNDYYGATRSYQTPRYFQFTAKYEFKIL